MSRQHGHQQNRSPAIDGTHTLFPL
jgi:hypothetical protein